MLKGVNWKAIFKGCAWVICLAGVVVLMSFIDVKKHDLKCTNVKILIPGADNFIEREEVDALLLQSQGTLIGRDLQQINLNEIEEKMESNPYIAAAKIYADMDGVIHIEIKQRQPVLRVINAGDQDFYIDRFGLKMPVSANFTANVLVATGNIDEPFNGRLDSLSTKKGRDLYKAAFYIKEDTLWHAQIEQIYVDERKDMVLIPRVGNQRIILGNADSLDVKMNNLLAFYKKVMPKVGWDTYKTINIKYTNQVICERIKPDSSLLVQPGLFNNKKPPPVNKASDSIVKNEKTLPEKTN
ncbi:cell division protein FtsQ/DivIB [Pedobacter immunditicola]|uniref:cell division protein FtsQ/DivIB n=1 Tax=Pedobacter immunditicola TaxID=3133440 RepID=UPI0030B54EBF